MIVDQAVAAVLEEYQVRAAQEEKLMQELPPEELVRRADELLLPVGPATGSFINLLVKEMKARSLLEVGSSYGYSTIWLAEAARVTGGQLISLELRPVKAEHARAQLERAGLARYVQQRLGDALATLKELPGPFDFVLIDLWKDLYVPVFEQIYPKLAPGAVVVADNMILPEGTQRLARIYREHVRAAADMTSVLLPMGSGIEVSRFKAP
jgi:predicted O-methyltransferase YrrM